MKKLMMIAALLVATVSANAQFEAGTFSLQPKIGGVISKVSNMPDIKIPTAAGVSLDADKSFYAGALIGVEAEYQLADMFSLAAGLNFAMQGCQWEDSELKIGGESLKLKDNKIQLNYLNLAKELLRPDTTIMKAITLSEGEGYYLTQHYPEAVEAWKEHLTYNPGSVATYFNIANAYAYILKDEEQARYYYQQFLDKAAEIENPTPQLNEMVITAQRMLQPPGK